MGLQAGGDPRLVRLWLPLRPAHGDGTSSGGPAGLDESGSSPPRDVPKARPAGLEAAVGKTKQPVKMLFS